MILIIVIALLINTYKTPICFKDQLAFQAEAQPILSINNNDILIIEKLGICFS